MICEPRGALSFTAFLSTFLETFFFTSISPLFRRGYLLDASWSSLSLSSLPQTLWRPKLTHRYPRTWVECLDLQGLLHGSRKEENLAYGEPSNSHQPRSVSGISLALKLLDELNITLRGLIPSRSLVRERGPVPARTHTRISLRASWTIIFIIIILMWFHLRVRARGLILISAHRISRIIIILVRGL